MVPDISSVASRSAAEKQEILSELFEPSEALARYVVPMLDEAASSWSEAIERIRARLHNLPPSDACLIQMIGAHPRLGAAKVDSAHSRAEQKSLQHASAVEAEQLRELNAAYEQKFPGLRYVVFVAGRPRSVIIEDMRRRIATGTFDVEVRTAIDALCDIALDRLSKSKL